MKIIFTLDLTFTFCNLSREELKSAMFSLHQMRNKALMHVDLLEYVSKLYHSSEYLQNGGKKLVCVI
jgi:glycerol-3-phosphate responsive antiterminator